MQMGYRMPELENDVLLDHVFPIKVAMICGETQMEVS